MQKPPPTYSIELVFHPARDISYEHFTDAVRHPFEPRATAVPRVNAWWMADAALASYWDALDAEKIFVRAGLTSTYLKRGPTDCYVAWEDDFAIVTFRGT